LNLAGAPEAFTGHVGHYAAYHFNEMPVVDEAGWKAYVATLFAHLARRPWFARAEVSFFNEPNCRWTDMDGTIRRFGFQGDAGAYARQYLWTWEAMKPYVRPGQVRLGPWVAEPEAGDLAVNNLPEFLRALRAEFARAGEPLPPWSAFSFNVYETPQLTLDGLAATKIAYVRRVLAAELPGPPLPLRLDEIGLHPVIGAAFARDGGGVLDETRWAAAWHAEMLALLVDRGIARADSWLSSYTTRAFASYLFASEVAHAVRIRIDGAGALWSERDDTAPAALSVRLGSRHADRVGALWSRSDDGRAFRVALWRYPRFAATDARLAEDGVQPVDLRLPRAPGRVWRVRVLGDAAQRFPAASPGVAASARRIVRARDVSSLPPLAVAELASAGRVPFELHAADVFLVEATASDAPVSGDSRALGAAPRAPDR
jgi:hypothetical protein